MTKPKILAQELPFQNYHGKSQEICAFTSKTFGSNFAEQSTICVQVPKVTNFLTLTG